MKKSTYTKFWIINLLALVALITSVSLVAYWPIAVKSPEGGSRGTTINLGSGGEVTTLIDFQGISEDTNLVLVPEGEKKINEHHKTESITRSLKIIWDENLDDSTGSSKGSDGLYEGDLFVSAYIVIPYEDEDNREVIERLLVIEFDNLSTINFKEETEFNVTIKLNKPRNEAEYYIIRGREISIRVTFNITNPREKQ